MDYNLNIDSHIGSWGYTKNYIRSCMSGLKKKSVNVRISSLGGAVDDALDIRQQFIDHGDVTAYLYGYVASSATIIATGAKHIAMSKYAFFLVHKVSNWVDAWGSYNADQMDQLIEDLKANKLENDKMDLVLASMYAEKCGKKIADILEVLKEGKWLTAKEALAYGFIDEILEEGEKMNVEEMKEKFNMLNLPAIPTAVTEPVLPASQEEAPGWFTRFIASITPGASGKQNSSTNYLTEKLMKKEYQHVNTLLGVEGFNVDKEGNTALSEEQVKKINETLETAAKEKTASEENIKKLNEEIEVLKKADGGSTTKIEGGEGEANEHFEKRENAVKMFDQLKNVL